MVEQHPVKVRVVGSNPTSTAIYFAGVAQFVQSIRLLIGWSRVRIPPPAPYYIFKSKKNVGGVIGFDYQ